VKSSRFIEGMTLPLSLLAKGKLGMLMKKATINPKHRKIRDIEVYR
jgi:hypothetical protein